MKVGGGESSLQTLFIQSSCVGDLACLIRKRNSICREYRTGGKTAAVSGRGSAHSQLLYFGKSRAGNRFAQNTIEKRTLHRGCFSERALHFFFARAETKKSGKWDDAENPPVEMRETLPSLVCAKKKRTPSLASDG